ncbi:MAG TPA: glycosylasparaginase, partial [Chitinophagaceae bacterium]
MIQRRRFLQLGSLGVGTFLSNKLFAGARFSNGKMPLVISTWDAGINANKAAWQVLKNGGRALDA